MTNHNPKTSNDKKQIYLLEQDELLRKTRSLHRRIVPSDQLKAQIMASCEAESSSVFNLFIHKKWLIPALSFSLCGFLALGILWKAAAPTTKESPVLVLQASAKTISYDPVNLTGTNMQTNKAATAGYYNTKEGSELAIHLNVDLEEGKALLPAVSVGSLWTTDDNHQEISLSQTCLTCDENITWLVPADDLSLTATLTFSSQDNEEEIETYLLAYDQTNKSWTLKKEKQ